MLDGHLAIGYTDVHQLLVTSIKGLDVKQVHEESVSVQSWPKDLPSIELEESCLDEELRRSFQISEH